MKLDLRLATLVLTGAWNSEIFTPAWIAQHLYGYSEGDEAVVNQLLMNSPNQPPKIIYYIDNVGVSVSNGRLELYTNDLEDTEINRIETVARNAVSILQHTPMGAVGVNFDFVEENPPGELLDKLNSPDGLKQRFIIKSETFTSKIEIDENIELNLTRNVNAEFLKIGFNFHCSPLKPSNSEALITGLISERHSQTLNILKEEYGFEEVEILRHEIRSGEIMT